MKKKLLMIPIAIAASSCLVGCNNNGKGGIDAKDGKATLTVTYARLGYGDSWLKEICKKYNEKTGVGFKFNSRIGSDGVSAIDTEVDSKSSDADLIFTKRNSFAKDIYAGKVKIGGTQYDCLYADISDVWNNAYEKENKTIKEKMNPQYEEYFNFDGKYYGVPWANGIMGIVRNHRLWDAYNLTDADVPLTTNDMLALCNRIQTTGDKKAAWIYSFQDEYYTAIANIFTAQYEGKEVTNDYFLQGKDPDGKISSNFYTYDGQKESLSFMKDLIDNYQHPNSKSMEFTLMQSSFLLDEAMFSINGSWLESEMGTSDRYAPVDFIKFPVLSALSKRLSFKNDAEADAKLHELVAYVDEHPAENDVTGAPSYATSSDIQKVREARQYAYLSSGTDHQAFIPVYSKHIDEGKDFLKYLYSDEGLNTYYTVMKGATLAAVPTTGYADLDLSTATIFRKSINEALDEKHLYLEMPKAKFFSVGEVNYYYMNGCEGFVKCFVNNLTVDYVLSKNTEYIVKNWTSIQTKLGLI